jgi:divalent metal cation (Fe/Co/Zn/Cd) transporter
VDKIRKIVTRIPDVTGVNGISIHDYGVSKVVSLEVYVENDLPLDDAHEIANKIENRIERVLNYATIIHLEPKETHPDKKISKQIIANILEKDPEIFSFHKIQIIRYGKSENIKMHLIVDKDMPVGDSHKLCHNLEETIKNEYGECKVDIHLEPCKDDCRICSYYCKRRVSFE